MHRIVLASVIIFLFFASTATAQFETVEYSRQNSWFNNGQPLPAESHMMITGNLPREVQRISIDVYKGGENGNHAPLATSVWMKDPSSGEGLFRVPLTYPLKGGAEYDISVRYYSEMNTPSLNAFRKSLEEELDRYLDEFVLVAGKDRNIQASPRKILAGLKLIVTDRLEGYIVGREQSFEGFSETVAQGVDNLDDWDQLIDNSDEATSLAEFNAQIKSVKSAIHSEVAAFLQKPVYELADHQVITNYETEKTRNTLAVNAGYGGVFLEGDLSNLSYGASPYVGISLPLSNRSSAPALFKNSSVSFGVFVNNFENAEGDVVTGPVFGRPYYLGVGYTLFRFVRLNAGATALETPGSSSVGGGSAGIDVNAISLRPFIGLSAEFELWAGVKN